MAARRERSTNRSRGAGSPAFIASHELVDEALQPNTAAGDPIEQTISVWQKHTKRQLTREDGREIIENMTGFFRILQEWDRSDRARQNAGRP